MKIFTLGQMSVCGSNDVCPYCLQRFSKPTTATGVTLENFVGSRVPDSPPIDLQPWLYDDQIYTRREAKLDELSPNHLYTR